MHLHQAGRRHDAIGSRKGGLLIKIDDLQFRSTLETLPAYPLRVFDGMK